jgi:aspartokinase/homoserine dehydrogenase 1
MKVLKFGGTSVGSADNIKRVKEIVDEVDDQVVVVVSAMGGITDRLIKAANLAAKGDSTYISPVEEIVELHKNVVTDLFPAKKQQTEVLDHLASEFDELKSINKGVFLIRELSHKSLESISGIGERLSSKIIASYIKAQWFDSRGYIKSYYEYGKSQADLESTNKVLKEAKHQLGKLSLFPGDVRSNKKVPIIQHHFWQQLLMPICWKYGPMWMDL